MCQEIYAQSDIAGMGMSSLTVPLTQEPTMPVTQGPTMSSSGCVEER